jgi:5-methylcytosine-specific restriction endonuclease McrA
VKNPKSRYIPVQLKRKLFKIAGHQCQYISNLNGKRCSEKRELAIDHIYPFAMGGETKEENLRILCRSHNILAAKEFYGRHKIDGFVNVKS